MITYQPNFSKFHDKIIGSVFYLDFYRYIRKVSFKEIIFFYLLLYLIAYSVPIIKSWQSLKQEHNNLTIFLDEVLQDFPLLEFAEGKMVTDIKQEIYHNNFSFPIISIDNKQNYSSTQNASAVVNFYADSFTLNESLLFKIILNKIGIGTENNQKLENFTNTHNYTYGQESFSLDKDLVRELASKNLDISSGSFLFFTFSLIAFEVFFTFVRALFFALFIFLNIRKINLNFSISYRLALAALIPSSCLNLINIVTLWNSYLLNSANISFLIFLAINLYFCFFSIKSLLPKNESNL